MLKLILISLIVTICSGFVKAQINRIDYNNQKLFLSGSNLAWLSFASDVNTVNSKINANTIADWMLQMHDHGGNAMRWWLHTDGTTSPAFDANNFVSGPGATTITDIKRVLDLAWEREIGIDLCLWSFDMLNKSKSFAVIARNTLLLTDTTYTNAYIRNCLKPMVEALKGHPGILTWEIFNEPEGMSNEFGWSQTYHVSMTLIQRFVNLCASAIHDVDPTAKVTNGTWAFAALTDVLAKRPAEYELNISIMTQSEKINLENFVYQKYGYLMKASEIIKQFQKLNTANKNYYSDNQLIAAGGKLNGTLDFYSVHYYTGLGASNSPFIHSALFWGLNKPIVVGEFACSVVNDNIPKDILYKNLYSSGYAGALAWSWTDPQFSTSTDMLAGMQSMWDNYRSDVNILGIAGDYPTISITSPANGASFPGGSQITITATANDTDGSIASVQFYVSDTVKIGEALTSPYSFTWTNISSDIYKLTAVATDNQGHKRTSASVLVTVGSPPMTRLEAEVATKQGSGWTIASDANASGRAYVNFATNDSTVKITWQFNNISAAGSYEITFGYKLAYNTPKGQYINVNGKRVTELMFDGNMNVWLEKKLTVNLVQGINTIQMQMSWGWMYVDYLAVPSSLVTSVENISALPKSFSLQQNYPNPFNPSTVISYQLSVRSKVSLKVYDVLGREVTILVNEVQQPGNYKSQFSILGYQLSSGVYFYRLQTDNFVATKKMMLIK